MFAKEAKNPFVILFKSSLTLLLENEICKKQVRVGGRDKDNGRAAKRREGGN